MIASLSVSSPGVLLKMLPGPERKRTPKLYAYRVTYRNPIEEPGCVMTWEVEGGREAYQVALERTETGHNRWHCTCADAIFRGEVNPCHVCKHVSGLLESIPTPIRKHAA